MSHFYPENLLLPLISVFEDIDTYDFRICMNVKHFSDHLLRSSLIG